jgi:hypothetical protein
MHTVRRTVLSATAFCAASIFGGATPLGGSAAAANPTPQLPLATAAIPAAQWLAGQLTPSGFIPEAAPATPNLSATANAVLALAATSVDPSGAQAAMTYLESNSTSYIQADGTYAPGPLSLLILDAEAMGVDPTSFDGNLVSRLQATEQATGIDTGLFGTETQLNNFDAGTFDQGLALAALKSAGVTADTHALTWLAGQQCSDGGWALPDAATNSCTEDPATFSGPDTNSTSMAVQGLAAQGALTTTIANSALSFIHSAQNSDGGWGYQPTNSSDPDSTGLVIQALLALGQSPTGATYTVNGQTPVTVLLSFQITTGADTGAFYFPGGGTTTGNVLATYQSTPALANVSFPFAAPTAPAPTVTSVTPNSGLTSGGSTIDIVGTNLTTAGEVHLGAAGASFTVESATLIQATTSAASSVGSVAVAVATLGGTSATNGADTFTYTEPPPNVSGLSPQTGPPTGGTAITITGQNFTGATSVSFGSTPASAGALLPATVGPAALASQFTVVSPTSITVTSPPGTGTVDVQVTTPTGASVITSADQFTYAATVVTPTALGATTSNPIGSGTSGTSDGTGPPSSSGSLALTGFDLADFLFGGLALIGLGTVVLVSNRRVRLAQHVRHAAATGSPGDGGAESS